MDSALQAPARFFQHGARAGRHCRRCPATAAPPLRQARRLTLVQDRCCLLSSAAGCGIPARPLRHQTGSWAAAPNHHGALLQAEIKGRARWEVVEPPAARLPRSLLLAIPVMLNLQCLISAEQPPMFDPPTHNLLPQKPEEAAPPAAATVAPPVPAFVAPTSYKPASAAFLEVAAAKARAAKEAEEAAAAARAAEEAAAARAAVEAAAAAAAAEAAAAEAAAAAAAAVEPVPHDASSVDGQREWPVAGGGGDEAEFARGASSLPPSSPLGSRGSDDRPATPEPPKRQASAAGSALGPPESSCGSCTPCTGSEASCALDGSGAAAGLLPSRSPCPSESESSAAASRVEWEAAAQAAAGAASGQQLSARRQVRRDMGPDAEGEGWGGVGLRSGLAGAQADQHGTGSLDLPSGRGAGCIHACGCRLPPASHLTNAKCAHPCCAERLHEVFVEFASFGAAKAR